MCWSNISGGNFSTSQGLEVISEILEALTQTVVLIRDCYVVLADITQAEPELNLYYNMSSMKITQSQHPTGDHPTGKGKE